MEWHALTRCAALVGPLCALGLLVAACAPDLDEPPETLAEDETLADDETPHSPEGDTVTLRIESWRSDDAKRWEQELIPAFEEEHPGIALDFSPTTPTEYDEAVRSRLEDGTAGDVITCRAFDWARALHADGFLADVDDLEGLVSFDDAALHPWRTDGDTQVCVPVASVVHGYYYNVEALGEAGATPPGTHEELFAVLDAVARHGAHEPLAWGTADSWTAVSTAFDLAGPNFWDGEEGRQALLAGERPYTHEDFVAAWEFLDAWQPYFPDGYEAITYEDTQQLFASGQAAVLPAGSWEISLLDDIGEADMGVFMPTVAEGQGACHITDHPDLGAGMNPDTDHPEEVETFLEWVTSQEFAELHANAVPGFFPLGDHDVELEHPLAREFASWRDECETTVRINAEELTAGDPGAEREARRLTVRMWNEDLPPEEVAAGVQAALESWYEPQQ